jgi:hypothetical protein
MSVSGGPNISEDGLVLALDAANTKSYPGSGTSWNDLSGNNITGTLTNGPIYNSVNGGSIVLDGVNDYIQHSSNLTVLNNVSGSNEFTCSSWFKLNTYVSGSSALYMGILMKGGYNPSWGITLQQDTPVNGVFTRATFYYGVRNLSLPVNTPGYGNPASVSTQTLQLNTWYKVDFAHTFTGTTHTFNFYINGQLHQNTAYTNQYYPVSFQNTQNVFVGYSPLAGNYVAMNCSLANYSIYTRTLSAQEILQNFNATRSRFGV